MIPNTFAPGEMSLTGVAFAIGVALLKPRLRGSVTLASSDPKVPPRIDLNPLDDALLLVPSGQVVSDQVS
jgi:hypothetical protein